MQILLTVLFAVSILICNALQVIFASPVQKLDDSWSISTPDVSGFDTVLMQRLDEKLEMGEFVNAHIVVIEHDGWEGNADDMQKAIDTLMSGVNETIVKNANRLFAAASLGLDVWGGNIDTKEFAEPLAIAGYAMLGAETIKDNIEDHFSS